MEAPYATILSALVTNRGHRPRSVEAGEVKEGNYKLGERHAIGLKSDEVFWVDIEMVHRN